MITSLLGAGVVTTEALDVGVAVTRFFCDWSGAAFQIVSVRVVLDEVDAAVLVDVPVDCVGAAVSQPVRINETSAAERAKREETRFMSSSLTSRRCM